MTASLDQPNAGAVAVSDEGGDRPRVVVGVDGSAGSRAAMAYALIAAARRGADVDVVCSWAMELYYGGGAPFAVPDLAGLRDDVEASARNLMTEVREELALSFAPGIRELGVTLFASSGPAAHALLERSAGAALLVVGSRGRGAVRSALLGSVALHCVTHATCPVVVVHPTANGHTAERIVVGVDGSEGSRAALAAAIQEAGRTGAEVEALATYVLADHWTDLASVVVPPAEEVRAELEGRTRALVDEALTKHSDDGARAAPTVRIAVVGGAAPDVLLDRARTADLLVVGSRGYGAFRGLLLGSVALHCAMHAPCPVMVVHPEKSRSTAAGRSASVPPAR